MTTTKLNFLQNRKLLIWAIFLVLVLVGYMGLKFWPTASSYTRLWQFKERLSEPGNAEVLALPDGLQIVFKEPAINEDDVLTLGLRSIPVTASDGGFATSKIELTCIDSDRQKISAGNIELSWKNGLLVGIKFPAKLAGFLSPKAISQYLAVLSRSKIDATRRTSYLPKDSGLYIHALVFPSRGKVIELFGPPRKSTEKVPYRYDTYEISLKGIGDVSKTCRIDIYYQAWSKMFKYGQVKFAGYGILFDEAGIVIKR